MQRDLKNMIKPCKNRFKELLLLTTKGPLLILVYNNNLSENLQCNPKLFPDNTPLFSAVKIPDRIANSLSNNLKEINS